MKRISFPRVAAACLTLVATGGASVAVPDRPPAVWPAVKCDRYKRAWAAALGRFGTEGLSPAFLARHDAFLSSNCTRRADVCPHSPDEFKLANIMVILAMNAGTASTFPPFACPRDEVPQGGHAAPVGPSR